jgi:hypothetical protein
MRCGGPRFTSTGPRAGALAPHVIGFPLWAGHSTGASAEPMCDGWLSQDENLEGLSRINRELLVKAEAMDSPQRVVLDMDSTEIPVYGEQEQSAYNGHFESTCYHPLLLFNGEGDCLGAKLRPGNVHSAENWEELLLPEVERQQQLGKEVVSGRCGVCQAGDLRGDGRTRGEVCDPASRE